MAEEASMAVDADAIICPYAAFWTYPGKRGIGDAFLIPRENHGTRPCPIIKQFTKLRAKFLELRRALAHKRFLSTPGGGEGIGSPTKAGPPPGLRRRSRPRLRRPSKPRRQLPVRRNRPRPRRKAMRGTGHKNSNLRVAALTV